MPRNKNDEGEESFGMRAFSLCFSSSPPPTSDPATSETVVSAENLLSLSVHTALAETVTFFHLMGAFGKNLGDLGFHFSTMGAYC